MTVAVYVLAGIGAVTVLAAIALFGAGVREARIVRHIDAQAPPEPPAWVMKPDPLAEWERQIRIPGRVEQCIEQELQ